MVLASILLKANTASLMSVQATLYTLPWALDKFITGFVPDSKCHLGLLKVRNKLQLRFLAYAEHRSRQEILARSDIARDNKRVINIALVVIPF